MVLASEEKAELKEITSAEGDRFQYEFKLL
jgi:hypothetical protein